MKSSRAPFMSYYSYRIHVCDRGKVAETVPPPGTHSVWCVIAAVKPKLIYHLILNNALKISLKLVTVFSFNITQLQCF